MSNPESKIIAITDTYQIVEPEYVDNKDGTYSIYDPESNFIWVMNITNLREFYATAHEYLSKNKENLS